MIHPTIDLVLRIGRLLGTVRSLIIQTEQLLDTIENYTSIDDVLVGGIDL